MVGRTPALLKKGLFSSFHQPLPLTNRESQQLLDSITSSFRKNLDSEPSVAKESAQDTLALGVNKSSTSKASPSLGRYHVTDRHFGAVLSNPLFSHDEIKKDSAAAASRITHHFNVFDSAVAKGLMTPRRAAGFLAMVSKESDKVRKLDSTSTGAALRVVQWLRASGQETDLQFLRETYLVKRLVPLMYEEGLEEVAWDWLGRLSQLGEAAGSQGGPLIQQPLAQLLPTMIKTSVSRSRTQKINLDTSYAALIRANETFSIDDKLALFALMRAWLRLSWSSTVSAHDHPKASVPLFESFVDMGRPHGRDLDVAHLELHHPTTPTHELAVRYLHRYPQITKIEPQAEISTTGIRRVMYLAQDTANRLKVLGNTAEASFVERFLDSQCFRLVFDYDSSAAQIRT